MDNQTEDLLVHQKVHRLEPSSGRRSVEKWVHSTVPMLERLMVAMMGLY